MKTLSDVYWLVRVTDKDGVAQWLHGSDDAASWAERARYHWSLHARKVSAFKFDDPMSAKRRFRCKVIKKIVKDGGRAEVTEVEIHEHVVLTTETDVVIRLGLLSGTCE